MANEFYITAGLAAIDYGDIATVATNGFYITAGLPANDYVPVGGRVWLMGCDIVTGSPIGFRGGNL